MKSFMIRFGFFCTLWGSMIYFTSDYTLISLSMLIASLLLFFFLSNEQTSPYIYLILSAILFIHGLIIQEVLFTSLLLVVVTMTALFRFVKSWMFSIIGINYVFAICLAVNSNEPILATIFIGSLFIYLIIKLNDMSLQNKDQRQIHQETLAHYRQLKRMHVSAEEMAKTEERTRIAREIHDSVGHRLTALMMKLEILYLQNKDKQFLELKEMVNEGLTETREAVQTLQDSETKGILAVVQLIRKLEAENQLLVQFTLKEGVLTIPLSNEHGVVLYRVIQESLTNVMRHSSSKQVTILIGKSAINTLSFTISNPISSKEVFSLGFGLKNMQARVKEIGGQLNVYQTDQQFVIQGMIPNE